ncbi:F-box only protein 21-like [Ostrinia furnacalis]|uniref:F-box only protein 21-like n=1 Tax=Ostrinia furnacalis TaxID=93504 RepID=UPI00103AF548|nr:F-box only protein 21-like [Ostrinia furnacalis]
MKRIKKYFRKMSSQCLPVPTMEEVTQPPDTQIQSLPNEIVYKILLYSDCPDIVSFGATCKRFWELIEDNEILWRKKIKSILPPVMYDTVYKHCNGEWLSMVKGFHKVKKLIYAEILAMSPKFYWKCNDVTLEDVGPFFNIALSDNMSYYYVIFILQDLIAKGNAQIEKKCPKKPFTMTEMYYAKVVLRYLIHAFLALKWVRAHKRNELLPEIVVNFFLQWIDTVNLYSDTEMEKSLSDLADKVKVIINRQKPELATKTIEECCSQQLVDEKIVFKAIAMAIYQIPHMAITNTTSLDTLNIVKVLKLRCSDLIIVGIIYQSVAKRFGVHSELISFPYHLFLEWVDTTDVTRPLVYTIDLDTGDMKPKRRCPFSGTQTSKLNKYCPDSLLKYIYTAFQVTMGAIKNWNTQNAVFLLDFVGNSNNQINRYRNFLPYLFDYMDDHALETPLDITYLDYSHMELIKTIAYLDPPLEPFYTKEVVAKGHASNVKYAVGMICYHKKLEYVGIIRDWDLRCNPKLAKRTESELNLEYSKDQPFYYLVAADQSARYVAQENLVEIIHPTRLYHLEDAVAREFSHFDGFCYVPNDEKKAEYPDEAPIAALYRNRSYYRQ